MGHSDMSQRARGFKVDENPIKGIDETEKQANIADGDASILVIDDEAMLRELFYTVFTKDGHKVTLAAGSREGLEAFDKGRYDIVYTDLKMPEISGWEVASAIKHKDPSAVVVMITGWGSEMDDEKMKESGVDLFISKPFQIHQLQDSVAQAMRVKGEKMSGNGSVS